MPEGLWIAYYGDDFTGSTDVMEALARAGLRTVLFLDPPDAHQLNRFPGVRAVGVAGTSRSMSPGEMRGVLPDMFRRLGELAPRIVQYKVCSTFDSSPQIGSIGLAIELGREVLKTRTVPLVVGAPILGRYCVFANLFARSGLDTEPYRLDRHPTMRHHPTTPMTESDLRRVLAEQTRLSVGLVDVLRLSLPDDDLVAELRSAASKPAGETVRDTDEVLLFDVLYEEHLPKIGRAIWELAPAWAARSGQAPLFAAGSSGLNYALAAHWRRAGLLGEPPRLEPPPPVGQLVVVSGSCSPVAQRQIRAAFDCGFESVAVQPERLVDPEAAPVEVARVAGEAVRHARVGRSVVVHTCLGPEDERIESTRRRLQEMGQEPLASRLATSRCLGQALGQMLRRILEECPVPRAIVVGGDTSGYAARELGIQALEMAAPLAPGTPLCRAHAPGTPLHGMEIAFKGGQTGRTEFFSTMLRHG